MIRPVRSLGAAALLLLGGGAAAALSAQRQPNDSVVDRIVAVVGSKAILASNIEERLLMEFPQGKGLPPTPEGMRELRRQLITVLVNEELLVQAAERDTTIKVLDDDVTKSVDVLIKSTRSKYPSEDAWRKDLRTAGFDTPDEYRSWLTDQQKRALQRRDLIGKQRQKGGMKQVAPTEKEIRDYFDQHKAQFPKRSESVSFKQIVVAPPPKQAAKARALALADSILQDLRKGADFPAAARRFSMDPGSKDQGGDLGWVRRGQGLDQHFEDAAFSLRPGVVSDPVETAFGYHLIQVVRAQPAEVQVRHILIMPSIDSTDADSAQRIVRNLRTLVENGATFDSLQRVWHDKAEERDLVQFPFDSLPGPYREAMNNVGAGKVSAVFRLEASGDPLRSKYVIAYVTERLPAGDVRYEDVKEQIRAGLSEDLTQQRYLDKLRAATLVDVRGLPGG